MSHILLFVQALLNEISAHISDSWELVRVKIDWFLLDFFHGLKREYSCTPNHGVGQDTDRPDVYLFREYTLSEKFWGLVKARANFQSQIFFFWIKNC